MDEFLRDIHTLLFKEWILIQSIEGCDIKEESKKIILTTPYCHAEVVFNDHNLIELSVTNLVTDKIDFYLHFQMHTMSHAISLSEEMLQCVKQLINEPPIRVLLTCTSGLTTGMFAAQLNEATMLLSKNYEFDAIAYHELYDIAKNYDVILVAPQVSSKKTKLETCFKKKTVLTIPSTIFAKYDAGALLEFLDEHLSSRRHPTTARLPVISRPMPHLTKILTIATVRTSHRTRMIYRVFDPNNKTLLDNEVVKFDFQVNDLFDILDTVLLFHPDIPIIGISLPGIIRDGYMNFRDQRINVLGPLNKRYPNKRFYLFNDVNTLVSGYYISQNKYQTISFLYQPSMGSPCGIGSVFKGQLIEGAHKIEGEAKYLPFNKEQFQKTPEEQLKFLAYQAAAVISIYDPEILIVSCKYTNKHELRELLKKYFPEEYLPNIHFIEHFKEYGLLGALILSIQEENKG